MIAFNATTNRIDRERFFVRHEQRQWGDNTDLSWTAKPLGLDNRLVVAIEYYDLDFVRSGAANFPSYSVSLIDPACGF